MIPLLILACAAHAPVPSPAPLAAPPTTAERYAAAIADAAVYVPGEERTLKLPEGDAVTVVSWAGCRGTTGDGVCGAYRAGESLTVGWEVWVTVVPEVQDRCRSFAADGLTGRLQELLGLPARDEARSFVVMQVPRAALFRPCPDPSLDATSCVGTAPDQPDQAHMAWLAGQMLSSWQQGGYPFTRLGYTYDWAADATDHYGASEYVFPPGTEVLVTGVWDTAAYCAAAP